MRKQERVIQKFFKTSRKVSAEILEDEKNVTPFCSN